MEIREAEEEELDRIMEIYASARVYMAAHGNESQWGRTNPPVDVVRDDIRKRQCYVCLGADHAVHGVFALVAGEDATYGRIDGGDWLNDEPYLTIHRIASDGSCKGVFHACLAYSRKKGKNLRIDTHRDNAIMHDLLDNNGFVHCGTIYLANGDPRDAYQLAEDNKQDSPADCRKRE